VTEDLRARRAERQQGNRFVLSGNDAVTNTLVGLGSLLQIAGFGLQQLNSNFFLVTWCLIVASIPLFVAGCMNFAVSKRQSAYYGLAGLFGILGLLVLVILPDRARDESATWPPLYKLIAMFTMLVGFGIAIAGLQLDRPLAVSDRTDPLPFVCMLGGSILAIASLLLIVRKHSE
jgi:hypothetical protein